MSSSKQENNGDPNSLSHKPEGTWRKVRRVKKGTVAQANELLCRTNGKQSVENLMIPEKSKKMDNYIAHKTIPGLFIESKFTRSQKKKAAKETQQKVVDQSTTENLIDEFEAGDDDDIEEVSENDQPVVADPAKKLRNLKKRLREVEALERKIKTGELKNPESEQLVKVGRKVELMQEINQLEKVQP